MRRRDRQITDPAAIADLLSRCKVCRIAVTDRQGPYIVPLNFGYQLSESGALTLYFHSAQTGRKLSALQTCTGPVAFEMDCAHRLTAPGVGKEVGCTLGESRNMFIGLFLAPTVVAAAVKTAVLTSAVCQNLGYAVTPRWDEKRTDIIQAITLGDEASLVAFCQGVQKGAPVDAYVTPEPWDMPGYESQVIMAAGAFTMGASIELSADAPIREPFAAWMQGALTYPSGKVGLKLALQSMLEQGALRL